MEEHAGKRNKKRYSGTNKRLYEKTENLIMNGDKYAKTFWTEEGVRQGCTLCPVLFTLFMAHLEEVLKKGQDAVMVVGNKNSGP